MKDDQRDFIMLCISGFFTMMTIGLSFSMTPLYASEFTDSLFFIGFAVSGYFVIRLFSEIPWGLLSDRIGRRTPMIIGAVLEIIGAILLATASSIYQIVLGRIFWGVGSAAYFCTSTSAVADLYTSEKRGGALGIFGGIQYMGQAAGAYLSGYIVLLMGYQNLFYICAALFFVTLVLGSTLKLKPISPKIVTTRTSIKIMDVLKIFVNPVMIGVSAMIFTMMIQNSGLMNSIFPLYLKFELKMSVIDVGILASFVTIGAASGNIVGGWLSDKIGRLKVLTLAFIIGSITLFFMSVARIFWILAPFACVAGLCYGFVYCVAPVLVAESFPSTIRGLTIGTYRTSFDIGGLLGPFVTAIVASSFNNQTTFYFVSILLVLNLFVVFYLRKKKQP